jgi:hypothetical protein
MLGNVGVSFVNAVKHTQITVVLLLIMHERVSIIYYKKRRHNFTQAIAYDRANIVYHTTTNQLDGRRQV